MSPFERLKKSIEGVDVEALLKPSEPDAPLVERLLNPPSIYQPTELRKEAASRIVVLEAQIEGLINEAVGMADGTSEAEYIEKRLRATLNSEGKQ